MADDDDIVAFCFEFSDHQVFCVHFSFLIVTEIRRYRDPFSVVGETCGRFVHVAVPVVIVRPVRENVIEPVAVVIKNGGVRVIKEDLRDGDRRADQLFQIFSAVGFISAFDEHSFHVFRQSAVPVSGHIFDRIDIGL